MWLYIMSDKAFPEMILRFISGAGMNLQKNHIVSVRYFTIKEFSLATYNNSFFDFNNNFVVGLIRLVLQCANIFTTFCCVFVT